MFRVAANTKYSINRLLPPAQNSRHAVLFHGKQMPFQPPRNHAQNPDFTLKMVEFDWPRNFPAAPPPQREAYKERLGWMRQEVVCDGLMNTTSCTRVLWKTRTSHGLSVLVRRARETVASAVADAAERQTTRGSPTAHMSFIAGANPHDREKPRAHHPRAHVQVCAGNCGGRLFAGFQAAGRSCAASRITAFSPASLMRSMAAARGNHCLVRMAFSGQRSCSDKARIR